MALLVLLLGPLPVVVCLLSFYDSNEGGEEMTNSTSRAYKLSVVSVGFRAAVKVLRASGHGLRQRDLCKGLTQVLMQEEVLTDSPLGNGPNSSSSPVRASARGMEI